MTLIEITVALAVAGVLFAAVVLSVGSLTGAKAKEATTELAGTVRALYDTAALTGKTCRLVFDLPNEKDGDGVVKYRAECAASGLTTQKNRDNELREAGSAAARRESSRDDRRFASLSSSNSDGPSVQELMGREKQRVDDAAKYSSYTSEEVPERALPSSVRLSVWTRHQSKPVNSGPAYLYFFPQGYTERAQVAVRQGKNVWTLLVSPLTGKVSVVADEVEVPTS